ncbi:sodium/glutamate symporter [Schaalia turicensis]|uniref:sodium/glutamate symporter n=1 Tax=Schaalia turicensis TaxID=131111 RepID=UPI0036A92A95
MNAYTPWTMLVDAGMIGLLLAIGVFLRARVKWLQNMLVPASVIAGTLGLVLGPNVLGAIAKNRGWHIGSWQVTGIPFSEHMGTYASILIVIVFACMALTDDFDIRKVNKAVGGFASYGVLMYGAQVALGMAFALLFLTPVLGSPDVLGIMLFTGWAGGFGTAAAVGNIYAENGQPEVASLAFTSATVGLLVGVIGGIILAKFGARRGQAKAFRGMDSLPDELRTGVLDANKRRPALGYHTFSGGSIETLSFEVGIVSLVAVAGYGIGQLLKHLFPGISFPLFAIAFLVGIVVRIVMNGVGASHLLDAGTLRSVSGLCTDILIVCGIASIHPEFVSDHILALGLLFLFGLILCTVLGLVVAPRLMGEGWFERQLFTWGWATGSVSTGLALLRIVDPKLESGTIEQFGYAYLPVVPVEISAVSFVPVMALAGLGWAVVGVWGAIAVLGLLGGWWVVRSGHANTHGAPGPVGTLGTGFTG